MSFDFTILDAERRYGSRRSENKTQHDLAEESVAADAGSLTIGLGGPIPRLSNDTQFANQVRAALNPLNSILDGIQVARLALVYRFVFDRVLIGLGRL